MPRRFPVLYGAALRRRHIGETYERATTGLIDELIRLQPLSARVLRSKARLLLVAGSMILAAVTLMGAGLISA